jgi:xanthine dehydrogenase YagS FAD-binding subunit
MSFDCKRKSGKGKCYALDGENQYHSIMDHSECASVCPSDMATVLSALDAKVRTADIDGGRIITVNELYNPLGTVLNESEIITFVDIPNIQQGTKQRFLKFRLRETIDFAIASVAAVIRLDRRNVVQDARIVLGGVSWKPYRALKSEQILVGEKISPNLAETVADAALAEAEPLGKNSYKVKIARALVKRAILD